MVSNFKRTAHKQGLDLKYLKKEIEDAMEKNRKHMESMGGSFTQPKTVNLDPKTQAIEEAREFAQHLTEQFEKNPNMTSDQVNDLVDQYVENNEHLSKEHGVTDKEALHKIGRKMITEFGKMAHKNDLLSALGGNIETGTSKDMQPPSGGQKPPTQERSV